MTFGYSCKHGIYGLPTILIKISLETIGEECGAWGHWHRSWWRGLEGWYGEVAGGAGRQGRTRQRWAVRQVKVVGSKDGGRGFVHFAW